MLLGLPTAHLETYKSPSQRARVSTEAWALANLFCPNCDSPALKPSPRNTPAVDYFCPLCDSPFQLKSQSRQLAGRITDAAYSAMRLAIEQDRTPNLFALHYEPHKWMVCNLIVIPRFVFSLRALERRPPLAPTARRAGWVGCTIVLGNLPNEAKIRVVTDGVAADPVEVRRKYAQLRPLQKLSADTRGWTLDVLNAIRSLNRPEFTLADAYTLEAGLARLHPKNRHVRDKIRQQLQILRDLGLLTFLSSGRYRLL